MAQAKFAGSNSIGGGTIQANSGTYKTQVALTAATATLTSAEIYDVMVGTAGTPADQSYEYDISRQTAAGTSTTFTPTALDSSKRAAGTVGTNCFTAEGTITANSSVFYIACNQRASYRWVAAPGSELIIPATNLAGFALRSRSVSGGTAVASAQVYFTE